MSTAQTTSNSGGVQAPGDASERILMVDDDTTNLQVLQETLKDLGYPLLAARSGEQALTVATKARPTLILLDIMMPGIDGYETLRRLKSDPETASIAVIFLSALDEVSDKVKGFGLGAVDYISKPFNPDEVIARVETHLKIRRLERGLARKNRDLEAANQRMLRDLEAAARVQQSFLPKASPRNEHAQFAWGYQPCEELGGDSLNVFAFDEQRVGMYVVDVCGHGVPSSLLAVTIARSLSLDGTSSLLTGPGEEPGDVNIVSPARVAERLNELFPMDMATSLYFTFMYGVLDTATGEFRFVAAGHPGPLVVRADGAVSVEEVAGQPVGLLPHASYEESRLQLQPGDRLYMFTDGLTEQKNAAGEEFGVARLPQVAAQSRAVGLEQSVSALIEAVVGWAGSDGVRDDVAVLAAEVGS